MDLSQYADLFLAESREHVSACNHLLLDWERTPAALEPVGGIFRAVHTVKGMAATMGYARVADLAHRMENLLDRLRKTKGAPGGDLLQLLFRATDLLERAIGLAVQGREKDLDVATIGAELDAAAKRWGAPAGRVGRASRARGSAPVPQAPAVEDSATAGR
ncbi:MAG TPA: Hpt domain-containing protein, partial [Gemmatimonadales bacterium]|nr:Hpt domain-containing protein [Gemmatimonadales bacterium]